MSVVKRAELLHAVADEINRRFDDFLAAELADTGKPRSLASHIDIPRGAANFKIFADIVKNVPTESFQMTTPDGGTAISYGLRTPLGVVGVICPWNLPLLLMTWKVGPALACGNTVIVKPSEETPATATLLGEVMNAVGIPKGVYQVLHGFGPGSAGEFITKHPGVNGITFTGETRTGEAIMAAAAKGVRPVSFELGGKNAGIVFADADFDKAIAGITRSAFENCGQVCLGTERVYVQRPIFDKFVAALKEKAEGLKIGGPDMPGVGIGPLISAEHKQKVMGYYAKAKAEGATVVTGGGEPAMTGEYANGHFVQPTIWTGLPESASVIREEIFGPCCHIAPLRHRRGSRRTGQRHRLRPGHHRLDPGPGQGAPHGRGHRGRPVLDQQLVPARPAHRLRRRQGLGHRPRRRRAFARVLHRAAQRHGEAVNAPHNPEIARSVRTGASTATCTTWAAPSRASRRCCSSTAPAPGRQRLGQLAPGDAASSPQDRRVIAPDMVGLRLLRPPGRHQAYNMDTWVQQALDLLDAHGHESRPTWSATASAARSRWRWPFAPPQRVRRLVLMGSAWRVRLPDHAGAGRGLGLRGVAGQHEAASWTCSPTIAPWSPTSWPKLRYQASIRPGFQESFSAMFPAPRQRWVDAMASPEAAIRALPHETLVDARPRGPGDSAAATSLTLSQWIPETASCTCSATAATGRRSSTPSRFVRLVVELPRRSRCAGRRGA